MTVIQQRHYPLITPIVGPRPEFHRRSGWGNAILYTSRSLLPANSVGLRAGPDTWLKWIYTNKTGLLPKGMMSSGGFTVTEIYGGYALLSATVLCCYEYFLTLDAELKYVWRHRLSAGSVLFVLNRYAILVASLSSVAQVLHWSVEDETSWHTYSLACAVSLRLGDVCILVVDFSYAVFAALRMYALHGKSKAALTLVLSVALVGPCAKAFLIPLENVKLSARSPAAASHVTQRLRLSCHVEFRQIGLLGRVGPDGSAFGGYTYFAMALRIHSLLLEILLLGMTWSKTLTRSHLRAPGFRGPFTTVLLRDGTLYFMATALIISLNLGGIAESVRQINAGAASSSGKSQHTDIVTALTLLGPIVDVITSICMSRFLLNLLAAGNGDYDTQYHSSRWSTVLRFAQVETLGGPLGHTSDGGPGNEDGVDIMQADHIELDDMTRRVRSSIE